jgi:hypothetical protein
MQIICVICQGTCLNHMVIFCHPMPKGIKCASCRFKMCRYAHFELSLRYRESTILFSSMKKKKTIPLSAWNCNRYHLNVVTGINNTNRWKGAHWLSLKKLYCLCIRMVYYVWMVTGEKCHNLWKRLLPLYYFGIN